MIRNQHLRTPSGYQRGKKGKKERKNENEQKKGHRPTSPSLSGDLNLEDKVGSQRLRPGLPNRPVQRPPQTAGEGLFCAPSVQIHQSTNT